MLTRWLRVAVCSALVAGCSASLPPRVIDDSGTVSFDFDGGGLTDTGPAPPHDAAIGDLAGDHWEGTVEGYTFPSGSSRVRIWFDRAPAGDGSRTGLVLFGGDVAQPRPTDRDIGYPPGYDFRAPGDIRYMPAEGFGYPIERGTVIGDHGDGTVGLPNAPALHLTR